MNPGWPSPLLAQALDELSRARWQLAHSYRRVEAYARALLRAGQ